MPDSSVPGVYLFTDDSSANVYYGGFDNFNTNDTLFDTILPKNSMLSADIANSILFKKSNLAPQEEYNFNFYIGFTIEQLIEQLVNSITSVIGYIIALPTSSTLLYGETLSMSSLSGGSANGIYSIDGTHSLDSLLELKTKYDEYIFLI